MVICLQRGADLHTAQLMPLPLTASALVKSRVVLPFWYRLTRVVLDKWPLNGCSSLFLFVDQVLLTFYFDYFKSQYLTIASFSDRAVFSSCARLGAPDLFSRFVGRYINLYVHMYVPAVQSCCKSLKKSKPFIQYGSSACWVHTMNLIHKCKLDSKKQNYSSSRQ